MAYQQTLTPNATQVLMQRLKQQQLDWRKTHGMGQPPSPDVAPSPTMEGMLGTPGQEPTASFYNAMQGARSQGLMRERQAAPGPMPFASPLTQPPPGPSPGAVRTAPGQANPWMMPQTPAGGLTPDNRAMIDAMTGKRVHKGMGGEQMGLQGVSPTLKYLLYSMQNRRHKGMGGKDVY